MRNLDAEIRNMRRTVAVEMLKGEWENYFGRVYNSTFFKRAEERIGEIFAVKKMDPQLKSSMCQELVEWANRQTYMRLADMTVYAPVGLKVSYLAYIEALEKEMPHFLAMEEELIAPTARLIGTLLVDPALATTKSGMRGRDFTGKLQGVDIDKCLECVAACFDANEKTDTIKYKQAYRRNAEIETVQVRMLQLQDNIARIDVARLESNVAELFKQSERLAAGIREDEKYAGITEPVTKQLSDQLYNVARWVEFFSVYRYQILTLSAALADTKVKLDEISSK